VEVARYLARIGRGTALCSDRTHIAVALRGPVEQRASVVQGATGSEQLAVGAYADRILKGANPADLPISLPTKFELVINLTTAKTLGIDVPLSLMLRADEMLD
jgi:hypothetical protein